MKLTLLGTAAAEGWPAAFCACPACQNARRKGGRDIRTRAGAVWGDDFKIDFGPDTLMQMQRERRSLSRLTTLVFTHGHPDHFAPNELEYRGRGFVTQGDDLPMHHVYANNDVYSMLAMDYPYPDEWADKRLKIHAPLVPFQPVTTHAGDEILPLPAAHSREALLLRLSRGGKHVLYGHDSGPFPDQTVQALADVPLDIALIDCTYGPGESSGHHLGISGVLDTVRRLREAGAVTEQTQVVATHFSHNGGLDHDALAAQLTPHSIQTAYDGMTREF